MKWVKKILIGVFIYLGLVFLLFYFDVFWRSSPHYTVKNPEKLQVSIMSMEAYDSIISIHRRPYIYTLESTNGGKVIVLGLEHGNDLDDPKLEIIQQLWKENKPDIALVEGKTWFLFTWLQNPIKEYGESGKAILLAKQNGVRHYTWEPTKSDEVKLLLQKYPAEKLAVFYTLRPYLAQVRQGNIIDPDSEVEDFIISRTNIEGLKGIISEAGDIDKIWKRDYPDLDWRYYVDPQNMYPPGFMFDIFNDSNLARDEHMIQIILDCIKKKKTVFITMGASHAPRIESVLKHHIK